MWPSNRCFEIARGTAQLVKQFWNYFYQSWKFNLQVKILLTTYPESVVHCLPCRQELVLSQQTKLQPDLIRASSKESWCDRYVFAGTKCSLRSGHGIQEGWYLSLEQLVWSVCVGGCQWEYVWPLKCQAFPSSMSYNAFFVVGISSYWVTFHLGPNKIQSLKCRLLKPSSQTQNLDQLKLLSLNLDHLHLLHLHRSSHWWCKTSRRWTISESIVYIHWSIFESQKVVIILSSIMKSRTQNQKVWYCFSTCENIRSKSPGSCLAKSKSGSRKEVTNPKMNLVENAMDFMKRRDVQAKLER